MAHVKKYFPHVEALELDQFSIEERIMPAGDLAGMANLQGKMVEMSGCLVPKFKSRIQKYIIGTGENSLRVDALSSLDENPDVLIFSDSFIRGIIKYLDESFRRTVVVPHNGLAFDTHLINAEKPDLVIYELIERAARIEIFNDRTLLNRMKPPILKDFFASPETQLKNIRFGDEFVLLGLRMIDIKRCQTLQLVWKSLKKQSLSYINAIHLVNKDGKILTGFDYPQNRAETVVNPGDIWLDDVGIPRAKMEDASALAIGIYTKKTGLLPIDRGERDWDGKRLLISLPLKSEPSTR